MLESVNAGNKVVTALSHVITDTGTDRYIDRLIDFIGEIVPHDVITVTRYSKQHRPEFVSHRRYSDEMIRKYLDTYYVFDPFYAYWRQEQRPGVVPLRSLATERVKHGRYIAEFLGQSVICDEVGVLVFDGEERCLGVFLDRASRDFSAADIAALEGNFPVFEALHRVHVRSRNPAPPNQSEPVVGLAPNSKTNPPPTELWPELSFRERELVALILAGHPTATLAKRLGIAVGTVKNHRLHIYAKLDITSERELFLQFFDRQTAAADHQKV